MPAMANITVKKADGTTDITYTALAGSSGEGVPALWRQEDAGLPAALRPSLRMTAKSGNNAGTGRRTMEALHVRPIVVTNSDGTKAQIGTHTVRVTSVLMFSDAQSNVDEAVAQGINLADSPLIQSAFKEGFAPRG